MEITYTIERFNMVEGSVDVLCYPTEAPSLSQRYVLSLLNDKGEVPADIAQVHAKIEASVPIGLFTTMLAKQSKGQDVTHIAQEQGVLRTVEIAPQEQGQLVIRTV